MRVRTLNRELWIPKPVAEVFSFFCEARNLDRITPPWLRFRVIGQTEGELGVGSRIHYRLVWHGVPLAWTSRIEEWQPPTRFVDLQIRGPYKHWHHTHSFEMHEGGTLMRDTVRYALPFGTLADLFAGWLVRRDVERIFDYRAKAISAIFAVHPASI
ncbi:MAG: SRPBCC family protein [Acidobacteriota bacterium]